MYKVLAVGDVMILTPSFVLAQPPAEKKAGELEGPGSD